MFDQPVLAAIKAHAIAEFPKECCGVVIDGKYLASDNVHEDPERHFMIAPAAYLAAIKTGGLQAIVHSHCGDRNFPSEDDMRQQMATALPWGILVTDGEGGASNPFWFGDQAPIPPLIGRSFRHGVTDCCTLIRDVFRVERQITFPHAPRDWEWWTEPGKNLYLDNYRASGFVEIDPGRGIEPYDVFLMEIRSPGIPNHAGVYIGRNLALHHLTARHPVDTRRLSVREPIGRWRNMITHWLRYRGEGG